MMRFRLQITLRIALILLLLSIGVYIFTFTPYWLSSIWFGLFGILGLVELIRFIEKSHNDLANFLMAIRQHDFMGRYPDDGHSNKLLIDAFNTITSEFLKLRNEKESNFQFLQTVVEHSGVPLMAYNTETREITLINDAAKALLSIPHLTQLDTLQNTIPELHRSMLDLQSDDKVLLKIEIRKQLYHISVIAKILRLGQVNHKVIALHDIHSELDQNEIESWQKLIRVLAHEIKNTAIPIGTLSEVIGESLSDEKGNPKPAASLSEEEENDLRTGLATIEKRSKGLVKFVSSYSDLTKIPKPDLKQTNVGELLAQVVTLEQEIATDSKIHIELDVPSSPVLMSLDPQLISQVLINLLKNAMEAVADVSDPQIKIKLTASMNQTTISVSDNGPGIEKEVLDNVFVPFYTTKPNGSGIGLSLSRQIIRQHKGQLKIHSQPGAGTQVTIEF